MKQLQWRATGAPDLSELLRISALLDSHAVGSATVYRLNHDGRELLAIALPDGQAVLVEAGAQPDKNRRRMGPKKA